MDKAHIIERLAALRPKLESRGVAHLAIFGSRGRGDHSPGSDLDLLIGVRPDCEFSLIDLIAVEQMIEDEIGIAAYGAMNRSVPPAFRRRIAGDLVEVF
jgi:hypothetical protein